MKNKWSHIAAFSMLEVTIVIALVALLSALFFGALNRFGEQVQQDNVIRQELNEWFAVRSNLWRELDEADSLAVKDNSLTMYLNKQQQRYVITDGMLERKSGDQTVSFTIPTNYIRSEQSGNRNRIVFGFDWKGSEMVLSYPLKMSVADKVNQYFEQDQWQR